MRPYYDDGSVTLYYGDMREVLPALDVTADACVTDPPYGETSLTWDRWPEGWPSLVAECTRSMWCFGSLRMFTDHWPEFDRWRLSHDAVGEVEIDTAVWEKHNGTGFATDRLRRVHELVAHMYRGPWASVYHETPRVSAEFDAKGRSTSRSGPRPHTGAIGRGTYHDDGTRLVRSVIRVPSVRRGAHRTEKPGEVLAPLIEYATPLHGLVLDPFAGSASTLLTARRLGRRAVGIEVNEEYCERAAERLSAPDLFGGAA